MLIFILVILITAKSSFSECPDSEDIDPCVCYSSSNIILCNGLKKFDSDFATKFSTAYLITQNIYASLIIQNLVASDLDLSGVQNLKIEKLVIDSNPILTSVNPISGSAFANTKSLSFTNNSEFIFNDDFSAFLALFPNAETLTLDGNPKLKTFKLKASSNLKLRQISLQNSSLSSGDLTTLTSLPSIRSLNLNYNKITKVTIELSSASSVLDLFINNNNVKDLALTLTPLKKLPTTQAIKLYLENNELTQIIQNDVFYFLNQSKNQMFLKGNNFECTCDYVTTTWIRSYNFQGSVHDLLCHNLKSVNIFNADLNCLSTMSPTPSELYASTEPVTGEEEPTTVTKREPTILVTHTEPTTVTKQEPTIQVTHTEPTTVTKQEPTIQVTHTEPTTVTKREPTQGPDEPEKAMVTEPHK